MPTIRITPPAAEPVTLAEARSQCRIAADDTSEDALLGVYIQAAREAAEHQLGRSIINTTWEQSLDGFPSDSGAIELEQALAAGITSVVYTNTAGSPVTMDTSGYQLQVAGQSASLLPAAGTSWPSTLTGDNVINTVRIRYVCGYGASAAAAPAGIRQWLLLTVGALYANREAVDSTGRVAALPERFVDRLLDAERVYG